MEGKGTKHMLESSKKTYSSYQCKVFFFLRNSFIFIIYLFIYLFLAVLGLCFCARAFSSSGERGPLFIAVRGPLTIAASLVAEHRVQTRRLSSCGSRAQLLRGMWDPPRPGLKPVSPALADRFSTTEPPGKPCKIFLNELFDQHIKVSGKESRIILKTDCEIQEDLYLNALLR